VPESDLELGSKHDCPAWERPNVLRQHVSGHHGPLLFSGPFTHYWSPLIQAVTSRQGRSRRLGLGPTHTNLLTPGFPGRPGTGGTYERYRCPSRRNLRRCDPPVDVAPRNCEIYALLAELLGVVCTYSSSNCLSPTIHSTQSHGSVGSSGPFCPVHPTASSCHAVAGLALYSQSPSSSAPVYGRIAPRNVTFRPEPGRKRLNVQRPPDFARDTRQMVSDVVLHAMTTGSPDPSRRRPALAGAAARTRQVSECRPSSST
jgi:hypothetical protein